MSDYDDEEDKRYCSECIFNINKVLKLEVVIPVGKGTYSRIYKFKENKKDDEYKIINVCRSKIYFNPQDIATSEFFVSGTFRECFFNGIINHFNIFRYSIAKYDTSVLGLYKTGELLDGDLSKVEFLKSVNEDIFFELLEDMVNALIHIHSYNIIHSDIKPSNILYKKQTDFYPKNFSSIKENTKSYLFKLSDFNLTQFCGGNDATDFKVFATKCFIGNETKKSIMVDIYMLGTTLMYISSRTIRKNLPNGWKPLTIADLEENKKEIINRVGFLCYNIIYLMITDIKDRIYLNHLQTIIRAYKIHKTQEEKSKLQLENIFDLSDFDLSVVNESMNEPIKRISTKSMYEQNIVTMMEYGHARVEKMFREEDQTYIDEFKKIHILDKEFEFKNKDKHSKILHSKLNIIFEKSYNIPKNIVGFFSSVIVHHPSFTSVMDWASKNNCSYKEINSISVKLCTNDNKIDYHFLICEKCNGSTKDIDVDIDADIDISIDQLLI